MSDRAHTSPLLDRQTLLDPAVCPSCGGPLPTARCARCGVVLEGSAGARVWALSLRISQLLDERDQILLQLRTPAPVAAEPKNTG